MIEYAIDDVVEPHFICESVPYCECAGGENPWDECCCMAEDRSKILTQCACCGEPMVAIDFDSGKKLTFIGPTVTVAGGVH